MKIDVLELVSWNEIRLNGKRKKCYGICRHCEDCIMGWDSFSYEGECEDYGCYFNYDFDVPLWKCTLPYWAKKLIKKMKRWED